MSLQARGMLVLASSLELWLLMMRYDDLFVGQQVWKPLILATSSLMINNDAIDIRHLYRSIPKCIQTPEPLGGRWGKNLHDGRKNRLLGTKID